MKLTLPVILSGIVIIGGIFTGWVSARTDIAVNSTNIENIQHSLDRIEQKVDTISKSH